MPSLDLGTPQRVHLVGVGGAGLNAMAEVLVAMGHTVSGSDATPSPVLDRLRDGGVVVHVGHDAAQIDGAGVVAASTAIPPDNPEVVAARAAGVPVLRRADLLAAMCALRRTVGVAGTHGKTTTSAMLATILLAAVPDTSFVVGGDLVALGSGAQWRDGDWFVVEADESDGTFLQLPVEVAVVTSVEPDHLEHWGSFDALVDGFGRFLTAARAQVVCGDDESAAALARRFALATYGFGPDNATRLSGYAGTRGGCRFTVAHEGRAVEVVLPVPGRYNARNATAALLAASILGVPVAEGAAALGGYRGVARRAHVRGERDGVTYVDDYAHLPGEVSAALAAAGEGGWRRVVCAFQPHRYSRTEALWRDFAHAFDGADVLAVTEVYPAGEPPRPGVTGKLIVDAVLEATPHRRVAWFPTHDG
ncbi:MAG: UDP-N-acetylmuramate--L-alanine ligase, partial [Acidimicrobiales bacterium]